MQRITFKILLIVILPILGILFFAQTKRVAAETIYFQDNFDDGDISDWQVVRSFQWANPSSPCLYQDTTNVWIPENGRLAAKIDGPPCVTEIIPLGISIPNVESYIFEVDMNMTNSITMDRNFVFKYQDSSNWYGIHTYVNTVYMQKVVDGQQYFPQNWKTNYSFQPNQTYHFKIELTSTEIKIFIDGFLIAIIPEGAPSFPNSKAGLQASSGSPPISRVWFDNIVVKSLEPELPSLNVPDIKQHSSPWNDDVYDHSSNWSSNPTIEHWGCALTSASMVLKYHGHDINPDDLNNWLNSQPDGYVRNGFLNWLAISRYTRINSNFDSPTLLFRRYRADDNTLADEIANLRPAIVKIPGHFAVVKGEQNLDFLVNDPASTNTLLSQVEFDHGGEYTGINSYISTSTDLSYILLGVDQNIELTVFDPTGNEIEGYTYLDEPLTDDVDGSSIGGELLKIFQFPAPPEGNYTVETAGSARTYTLDAYLYDTEGNVSSSSFDGLISEGQKDKFMLSVGATPGVHQEITIDSIIEDLDSARDQGLIKKGGFYRALKYQLLTARRLINRGRTPIAKRIISSILRQIRVGTPFLIDPSASEILQTNLQILIDSI